MPEDLADPDELIVQDFDVRKAVFIIPIEAPIPSELGDAPISKGTLYERLAPLTMEPESEFVLLPIAGAELIALDRVWRTFQVATRVFALFDLPGARYDVTFTQAVRMLGLHGVDWVQVEQGLAKRLRVMQRRGDKSPWHLPREIKPEQTDDAETLPDDDIKGERLAVPQGSDLDETA